MSDPLKLKTGSMWTSMNDFDIPDLENNQHSKQCRK